MAPPDRGVWVARYADRSAVIPFGSELEALRHAVTNHMQVKFIPWGEDAGSYQGRKPTKATRSNEDPAQQIGDLP